MSGFLSPISWRWTYWFAFIFAGLCLIILIFLPETYGPTILKHRAQKMRKESSNSNVYAAIELEKKGAKQMITVTLMRPLHMIAFEAIILFTCLYLSLAYAIFYLFFEAYPLIFEGIYKMHTGIVGLAFLPIIIGAVISLGIFLYYDGILQRAKKEHKPWADIEEYRRLPLACIGGPLYVISLFWLGWSANTNVHWIVPMLAGIPFGIGFMLVSTSSANFICVWHGTRRCSRTIYFKGAMLSRWRQIFMALLNFVSDAYEIYAASGMSATSICRSIFGAILPLAAKPMYQSLGISWASSLLGFLSLAMTIIPFAFIKYGDRIRANSHFCNELKERKKALAQDKAKRSDAMQVDVETGENRETS